MRTIVFLLALTACQNLNDRRSWSAGIDKTVFATSAQQSAEIARRYASLDRDVAECRLDTADDNRFTACMRRKGWSLNPAFGL